MAQRVLVRLIDDIDDSEASQTVSFALDGASYEVDLNDDHADELRAALDKFVQAGRRISGKPRPVSGKASAGKASSPKGFAGGTAPSSGKVAAGKPDNNAIRTWARENGYTLGDKGRIAASIVQAYEEAHGK